MLYLFETFHDPQFESQLKCQIFANFWHPIFANPEYENFQKCYTFLETSHNPQLESQLRCQNFAIFLATHLLKIRILKLPEVLPPQCYTFLEY